MNTNGIQNYKIRRAINFDLDTNLMKAAGVYPNGYKEIESFFDKQGYDHRQGSGYVSRKPQSIRMVSRTIMQLRQQLPWTVNCTKDLIMTDFIVQSDLTALIKGSALQVEHIAIEPLRVYKLSDKKVLVKLPGATLDERIPLWLPKECVALNKEQDKVIAVREKLQQKYGLPLPQVQPKRILR